MFSTLKNYKKYLLVILIAGVFIYIRSLSNGYNLDDELVTINHPLTNAEAGVQLTKIFSSPYSIEKFGYTYGYRPMVHLSFAIEHAIFGEKPGVSHLINLLIYLLTGVYLFYFLINWLGKKHLFLIGLSVLIFMVHPLHVEVVASIKNRDELMAFLAAIIAMNAYLRLKDNWSIKQLFVLFAFTLISVLSKKTAIPLLVLIPLLDVFYSLRWKFQSFLLFIPIVGIGLLVGSDFEIKHFLAYSFLVFPILIVVFIFFNYRSNQTNSVEEKNWFKSLIHYMTDAIQFAWNSYSNQKQIIAVYALLFAAVGMLFDVHVFLQIAIMGLFFLLPKNDRFSFKSNGLFLLFLITSLTAEFFISPTVLLLARQLAILIIAGLLLFQKPLIAGITAMVFFLTSFFVFSQLNLISLFLLLLIIVQIIGQRDRFQVGIKNQNWSEYARLGVFSVVVLVTFLVKLPSPLINQSTQLDKEKLITLSNRVLDENGIKEGRQLEFVENPLIYPHFWHEELATGIQVIGSYLQLEVFPYPLRYYYGYKTTTVHTLTEWKTSLWIIVLFALVGFAVFYYRKDKLVTIGLVLLLVPLFLASNIPVLVSGVIAERHAYASTLGFSILVALLFYAFNVNSWQAIKQFKLPTILLITLLFFFTLQSFNRVGDWESSIKLMEKDKEFCSSSAHANSLLATAYIKSATEDVTLTSLQKQKRIDQAINQIKQAIEVFPYLFNYHFDLGRFYVLKGDYNSAFSAFQNAYNLMPNHPLALDELVKCSFDLNRTEETLNYGEQLIKVVGPQEMTLELMAYQALTSQAYSVCIKWAEMGRKNFPLNQNFPRLIEDSKARKVVSKN